LPEKFRVPVLLCGVQGLSREEAARQLGCSVNTVKGRLERGRQRLAARLADRGLAPAAMLLAPLAAVAVPVDLLARAAALAADPWSKSAPPAVLALAAPGPRRFVPAALLLGSLLVAGVVGLAVAAKNDPPKGDPPAAGAPAPRPDEPLPAGAAMRFGTALYRHGTTIQSFGVSVDGTVAVAGSGGRMYGSLRIYDLTSGRVRAPIEPSPNMGGDEAVAISPDGRTVVVKHGNRVTLHDAATGKETRDISPPGDTSRTHTYWIHLSPDGKLVAVTTPDGRGIYLIDVEQGKVTHTLKHAHVVFAAAFTPDGKWLAGGGYDSENGQCVVRLWDVATGKQLSRFVGGQGGYRSLAFSPDRKLLAGGGDEGVLRLWDVATGKELRTTPKDGYRVRSVAFSPDGKTVAAAGDMVRLYDPATGKERLHIDQKASHLHFSADGKVLTAAVKGAIHRWDPATGRPLTPQAAGDSGVDQIIASSDGRTVVTRGQDGDAHVWDARTGALVRHVAATWQRDIALSPDGRCLAWPVADESVKYSDPVQRNAIITGSRLRCYDLAANQFVDRFPAFPGDAWALWFTPDGKGLITIDYRDAAVRVWDVAAGKEQRSFQAVPDALKASRHVIWHTSLSPDGRTLAVTYQPERGFVATTTVRLFDVATGKETHELGGHFYYVSSMAFSADGKTLVTAGEPLSDFVRQQAKVPVNQVFVWDVASGKRIPSLPEGLPIGATAAAVAPDGRTVATALPDGTIKLWETATWTVRTEVRGHRDRVTALTFGPDGRLYSGGVDTTVLAWIVRPTATTEGSLAGAWTDLAKTDATSAWKAQGRLLAEPSAAVALLAEKIKPAGPLDAKRVAQLIADLESSQFTAREQATRALRDLGGRVAPALRTAAEKSPVAEARRRAATLLDEVQKSPPAAVDLQALRAVELLEWLNTDDARKLLATWAKGAPGTRLTDAAGEAMQRLKN
jgi:WD40 repeat protein